MTFRGRAKGKCEGRQEDTGLVGVGSLMSSMSKVEDFWSIAVGCQDLQTAKPPSGASLSNHDSAFLEPIIDPDSGRSSYWDRS